MTTTREMREGAADLLERTERMREDVVITAPDRLPTLDLALADTRRAFKLLQKRVVTAAECVEIAGLLIRSNLLIEALAAPVQ